LSLFYTKSVKLINALCSFPTLQAAWCSIIVVFAVLSVATLRYERAFSQSASKKVMVTMIVIRPV